MRVCKPRAILLALEGTIVEHKFVSLSLFPFFRNNVGHFFRETYRERITKIIMDRLLLVQERIQVYESKSTITHNSTDSDLKNQAQECIDLVPTLCEQYPNLTELKELKLIMWVWAIKNGLLTSNIFEDVVPRMHKWKQLKIPMYIYSPGML